MQHAYCIRACTNVHLQQQNTPIRHREVLCAAAPFAFLSEAMLELALRASTVDPPQYRMYLQQVLR